jgi:hypothetical protein
MLLSFRRIKGMNLGDKARKASLSQGLIRNQNIHINNVTSRFAGHQSKAEEKICENKRKKKNYRRDIKTFFGTLPHKMKSFFLRLSSLLKAKKNKSQLEELGGRKRGFLCLFGHELERGFLCVLPLAENTDAESRRILSLQSCRRTIERWSIRFSTK